MSPAHGHDNVSFCTGGLPITFPPQHCASTLGLPKTPEPSFPEPGGFPQPRQVLSWRGGLELGSCGEQGPAAGAFGAAGVRT